MKREKKPPKKKLKELIYICDINYIALKTVTSLNSTLKILDEFKTLNNDVWIQVRPYKIFELIIPECTNVPKHQIIDDQKVEELMKKEYKSRHTIPQIYDWDAAITWLGARPGEFVEIDRYSPMVGVISIVRYVIS